MQFTGIDFKSLFDKDNFPLRRTTGHNMFDPESLISGEEINNGMDFRNSKRAWRNEAHYTDAVTGIINTSEILRSAPRVFLIPGCPPSAEMPSRLVFLIPGCPPSAEMPSRLEAMYALQMEDGVDEMERGD